MHEEMLELALNVFHELSKKSNIYIYIYIYKKMRLLGALCGGKWKKRKIRRWGRSEREKREKENGKIKVLGLGN